MRKESRAPNSGERSKPVIGRAISWLLRRLAHPEWREEVEGDIEELYLHRLHREGPMKARWRLLMDVLSAARVGPERFAVRSPQSRQTTLRKGNVMFSNLKQDLRYSLRRLAKSPGFALVCIVALALGIGANTAMFSVINGVLLEPLPYYESERLVRIHTSWKDFGYGALNQLEYQDILQGTDAFQRVGLFDNGGVNLTAGTGPPERIAATRATPSTMTALGLRALKGRLLQPGEEISPNHRVAVLSEGLWKRRFGGDESIIGKPLQVSGFSVQVIGILAPGVDYPFRQQEFWMGYGIDPENPPDRGGHGATIIARLKEGVSLDQAQAQLDSVSAQLRQEYPTHYPEESEFHFVAEPLAAQLTGPIRPALLVLMGAVGLVLLIACANVAGLLLARINARQREISIRKALGAGAGRLVSQVLWETLLLSLLGGLGALAVAQASFWALKRFHPASLPRLDHVGLAAQVFFFTFGLIVLTTLAAGLIPALRMTRSQSRLDLRERGGQDEGVRQRLRRGLVVAEVALATVLLLGAGLLVRSFQHLMEVDPGFTPENLLTAEVNLPSDEYPGAPERLRFFHQLLDNLEGRPGVVSAGIVNLAPMSGSASDWSITAEGYQAPNPDVPDFIQYRMVSSGYFETMRIPLVRGRFFEKRDALEERPVAIIGESLAKKFWGDQDPVGRRIQPGGPGSDLPWLTVVGVVGDVHHSGVRQGQVPIWYRPLNRNWRGMTITLRTVGDPSLALPTLREALNGLNPQLPLNEPQVMTEMVSQTLSQERLNTNLLAAFAVLALTLAAVGVYGVISYSVGRRTREIGIRMAVGASRRSILTQVMREGTLLVGAGLAIGLVAAIPMTRFLESMLFGIGGEDPLTLLVIAAVLLSVGLAACLAPARRATRVDPLVALRGE